MSSVRVLVGTRKGAFILTADGKRRALGRQRPASSPAGRSTTSKARRSIPNRIYASQSSGWFGQMIQRSDDGGKTWDAGRQQVRLRRRARHASMVRRHAASRGSSSASGISSRRSTDPDTVYAGVEDAALFRSTDGGTDRGRNLPGLRGHGTGPDVAAGRGRHVPAHDPARSDEPAADVHRHLGRRRVSHRRRRRDLEADQPRPAFGSTFPIPTPRSATACTASPCTRRGRACCSCRSIGT